MRADQAHLPRVRRLEQQLAAHRVLVEIVAVRAEQIVGDRVAARSRDTESRAEAVRQAARHIAAHAHERVVARGELAHRAERLARQRRPDTDRTGGDVAALQRRLRPAQHFDLLDVGKIAEAQSGARAISAIDEQAGVRLEIRNVALVADAADAIAGVEWIRVRRDDERWGDDCQVCHVANARRLELLGRDGRDGHRHFLERLALLARQ